MSDTVSREEVRKRLAQLRRPHVVREDSWYSCPLSDEPPSADKYVAGPQVCDCGAEAHNALLDQLAPHILAALDDAERMEWLEARQWIDMQRDIDGVWLEADDVRPERWIPSVRDAIDAARAGGEG